MKDSGSVPSQVSQTGGGRKPPRKRPRPKYQPPLMPLIDVVFTLLLFFLVAARQRVAEGMIPANLPDLARGPAAGATIRKTPLKITLYAVGTDNMGVRMQVENSSQELANAGELYRYLSQVKNTLGADVPIVIRPTGNVRWEHVVNAFNQAVRAAFKTVGFAPSGA
jgi:biopolymer transport protein ExbD